MVIDNEATGHILHCEFSSSKATWSEFASNDGQRRLYESHAKVSRGKILAVLLRHSVPKPIAVRSGDAWTVTISEKNMIDTFNAIDSYALMVWRGKTICTRAFPGNSLGSPVSDLWQKFALDWDANPSRTEAEYLVSEKPQSASPEPMPQALSQRKTELGSGCNIVFRGHDGKFYPCIYDQPGDRGHAWLCGGVLIRLAISEGK